METFKYLFVKDKVTNSGEEKMKSEIEAKKGTTTVGLKCKDCVVLASESKASMGNLVAHKEAKKVYKITDKIALTIAGGVGDAQNLIRVLKAEVNLYEMNRQEPITVKGCKTLLSNIFQGSRYFPIMAMLVLGGHDKNGYHLYSLDPLGGGESESYTATGSGSPVAYGVLENNFEEGMDRKDGIEVAVKAVQAAAERDVFSGGNKIQVAVVNDEEVELLKDEEIDKVSQK